MSTLCRKASFTGQEPCQGLGRRRPPGPARPATAGGGGRAGPQAVGHVATLVAVRPLAGATHPVRDPSRTTLQAVKLGSADAVEALCAADVVCATSAPSPLFDSSLLRDDAVVVAVGSHEPDARELDAALLGRATVVVGDVATAPHEAGDVALAIAEGRLTAADRPGAGARCRDRRGHPSVDRPLVFKNVGMSWQDLVLAGAVVRTAAADRP